MDRGGEDLLKGLAKVARESLDLMAEFASFTDGGYCDFRQTGSAFLHAPEDMVAVRETARMLGEVGTAVDILTGAEIDRLLPEADSSGIGVAVWDVIDGVIKTVRGSRAGAMPALGRI